VQSRSVSRKSRALTHAHTRTRFVLQTTCAILEQNNTYPSPIHTHTHTNTHTQTHTHTHAHCMLHRQPVQSRNRSPRTSAHSTNSRSSKIFFAALSPVFPLRVQKGARFLVLQNAYAHVHAHAQRVCGYRQSSQKENSYSCDSIHAHPSSETTRSIICVT